ncbi:hypothetical protein [Lentzea sp. NPDC051838]|uniref:hypothetical protein n=1 Tax=Lentzea sp. NPDC051838 TaxID=3154849 RepID=UPI0034348031
MPNDRQEVLVPEQSSITITASLAPQVAGGLHAVATKTLAAAARSTAAEKPSRGGDVITNSITAPVTGTVFQIGKVHGQVNDNRGR